MKIKYFSELTGKEYPTEHACVEAEKAFQAAEEEKRKAAAEAQARKDKLVADRKSRAAEVEAARKELVAAQKKYRTVLENFVNDYHSYHWTSNSADDIPVLFNLFDLF